VSAEPLDPPIVPVARVRARTLSVVRLSKRELHRGMLENPPVATARPRSRGECLHGEHAERPCPWVSCKHHLYLDVNPHNGNLKFNFPDLEVEELPETCALDVADRGGITLEEVGDLMNLTRERIRQVETRTAAKLKGLALAASLAEDYGCTHAPIVRAVPDVAVERAEYPRRTLEVLGAQTATTDLGELT
jgi:Sigma-70, region 4